MKGSLMFGDLDLYMDKDFFDTNRTGTFLLPEEARKFETLAVMKVLDSAKEIFKPSVYTDDLSDLCAFIESNAMYISADSFDRLKAAPDSYQVTALITCTDGSTGTRLVLLVMTKYEKPNKPVNPDHPNHPDHPDHPVTPGNSDTPKTGYDDHFICWLALLAASGTVFAATAFCLKRHFSGASERKKR